MRVPRHSVLARTSDTTVTLGGGLGVVGYETGCDSVVWWSAISRYAYDCWVSTWSSGEWYQTDRDYYTWTGSRWAYYGRYRCSKVQMVNNVVIVGPTPDHTVRCGWV